MSSNAIPKVDVQLIDAFYVQLCRQRAELLDQLRKSTISLHGVKLAVLNDEIQFEWIGIRLVSSSKPIRVRDEDNNGIDGLVMELRFVHADQPENHTEVGRLYLVDSTLRSAVRQPEGAGSTYWVRDVANVHLAQDIGHYLCERTFRSDLLKRTPKQQ